MACSRALSCSLRRSWRLDRGGVPVKLGYDRLFVRHRPLLSLLHNIEAIVFIAGTTKDECSKDGKRPIGGEHVEIPLRFLNVFPNRSGCPNRRPKLIAGCQLLGLQTVVPLTSDRGFESLQRTVRLSPEAAFLGREPRNSYARRPRIAPRTATEPTLTGHFVFPRAREGFEPQFPQNRPP